MAATTPPIAIHVSEGMTCKDPATEEMEGRSVINYMVFMVVVVVVSITISMATTMKVICDQHKSLSGKHPPPHDGGHGGNGHVSFLLLLVLLLITTYHE